MSLAPPTHTPKEYTPEEKAQMKEMLNGLSTDLPFSINALQILTKRYLVKNHDGQVLETPEGMFHRVAAALAAIEADYGASPQSIEEFTKNFEEIMTSFEFTPAGRTLANAGGPTRLVSNCIVLHIEDSMDHIFKTLSEAALLQQAGSGLGFPLHLLRPAGFITKKSYGQASGPVSFLHVYNTAFGVIKQNGRSGANMGVLSVDHPDILEFIHCKDVEGSIKNFNISVGLTHKFMAQVESNDPAPWMCSWKGEPLSPRRVNRDINFNILSIEPVSMTAREIFMEIVDSAWKTGEPGCVFLDTVNESNPLPGLGRIESCNPCGEQFLHDGDVCNLGSINLEKFVDPTTRELRLERLAHVTKIAVRMLDNVVDCSDFPVDRVNNSFRGNRRIGLGIMGMADALYQLRVGYNSPAGVEASKLMLATIQKAAHEASEELGREKGNFPNYDKSVFAAAGTPRRNAAVTNIAPTGTIAMMFDVCGGVEPYFALAYYYKGILGGDVQLSYVNKHLRAALEEHGMNKPEIVDRIIKAGSCQKVEELPDVIRNTFVTSMDISAEDHIAMQSEMQALVDNAISKTINFPNSATRDDILRGYIKAWQGKCKGCTVYRDGSRVFQVLNLNEDKDAEEDAAEAEAEDKKDAPVEKTAADDSGPLKRKLAELRGAPAPGVMDEEDDEENSLSQVNTKMNPSTKKARISTASPKETGMCPDCHIPVTMSEGCFTCHGCGMSACSM